jgi:hypothetical protein
MLRKYDWNECALDLGFTLYTYTWFSFNFWYTLEYFIKYLQDILVRLSNSVRVFDGHCRFIRANQEQKPRINATYV